MINLVSSAYMSSLWLRDRPRRLHIENVGRNCGGAAATGGTAARRRGGTRRTLVSKSRGLLPPVRSKGWSWRSA